MEGFSRRAFCGLAAAWTGSVAGCNTMTQGSTTETTESNGGASSASNEGETFVTTRKGLESAFEKLSPGDTIRIGGENAPYRTTEWLDIDVDGATVVGPGVRTLVKPATGANVGGIRIGNNERCRGVDIRGFGFHGNPKGQSDGAKRLHGIAVRDAADVTVERSHVRKTHPRKHGDGGSGISVGRNASDVRILNNQIHEFGDRGIQLAGKRLMVFGNVATNGLDRPVACDLWHSDKRNRTAQSVTIFGNLLGNSVEGSLVGVARNGPIVPNEGFVSIFGNVGFGSHKSFCHLRGPGSLRNISVQNNVSLQNADGLETEETTKFAGIAVDVAEGRNIALKNNELYGYSGHGIHVNSDVSDVVVQQNTVYETGLSGIRLVGGSDGLIAGNLVTATEKAGIRLEETTDVVARGNYVRRAGTAGIVSAGASEATNNDIADNHVAENGQNTSQSGRTTSDNGQTASNDGRSGGEPVAAIVVRDSGVRVRGNAIRQNDAPAILEGENASNNVYESNWADGERPFHIRSPTARTYNNVPPTGSHRGASDDAGDGVVRVEFDRPYSRRPRLSFGRVGGGVQDVSYETDGDGNYVAAKIGVRRDGATLDVFAEDA